MSTSQQDTDKPQEKSIPEHIETIKTWKTSSGQGTSKLHFIRTAVFTAFPALLVLFIVYVIMTSGKPTIEDFCCCD